MLLILIFCIPLKLLVKTEIMGKSIITGIYLYGLRLVNIDCNFDKNKITINKKRKKLSDLIKKLNKLKKIRSSKFKVSPKIITDLGLRFFINRKEDTDASDWAIQNALFKSLPDKFKISLKRSEESSINFSVYGFFTIFQIIFNFLANTKRR